MKNNTQVFDIKLHIYPIDVCFIVTEKRQDALNIVGKLRKEGVFTLTTPDFETANASCFIRKNSNPIIWVKKKPETPKEYGELVHEILHASLHIVRYVGFPFHEKEDYYDEPHTYLVGYITTQFLLKCK